jgi:hypothetical protein
VSSSRGETVLAHLVEDAAWADAEQPRGSRSVSPRRAERRGDEFLLAELERAL